MAQVAFDIEFEVEGHRKLHKTMKRVEDFYIRDFSGEKNREIMEKMRQKLQLMYPGAKISKRSSGKNMNFKIENIGQLNVLHVINNGTV